MASGKKQRKSRMSSGKRKTSKLRQACNRIEAKIKRWDRYRQEVMEGSRPGEADRWNTSGLQSHLNMLRKRVE